jgi:hypothetical protein
VTSGALVLSSLPAMAQDQPSPAGQPPAAAEQQAPQAERLGRGQLEKLLAPIALYPDDLVAQILTASTYPLEVVQAARWVNEHPTFRRRVAGCNAAAAMGRERERLDGRSASSGDDERQARLDAASG